MNIKRKQLLAVGGFVAALVLSGCNDPSVLSEDDTAEISFETLLSDNPEIFNRSTNLGCSVTAHDDPTARSLFSLECSSYRLVDCDPIDGGVICSSEQIGNFSPSSSVAVTVNTASSQACSASGRSFGDAASNFARHCRGQERRDCDPFASEWVCANYIIGSNGPGTSSNGSSGTNTASPRPAAASNGNNSGSCSRDGNNLLAARLAFYDGCAGYELADCDPIGRNWRCSSRQLGNFAPATVAPQLCSRTNTQNCTPITPSDDRPTRPTTPPVVEEEVVEIEEEVVEIEEEVVEIEEEVVEMEDEVVEMVEDEIFETIVEESTDDDTLIAL